VKLLRSGWRYVFAIGALAVLIVAVGPAELGSVLADANPVLVGLYAAGLALTSLLYATQVWVVFQYADQEVGWWETTRAAVTSWSVGLITPSRAGDFTLPFFLSDSVPRGTAVAVVATEKLMSLAWLATVALVVTAGLAVDTTAVTLAAGVVLASIIAVLAVASTSLVSRLLLRFGPTRLRRFAAETAGAMAGLLRQTRFLGFTLVAISARWTVVFGLIFLLFAAVGYHPPLIHIVAGTAIGRLLALVPVSVGGLGLKEPVQILIYALADVPAEAVVAVSVLGMASNYVVAALLPVLVGRTNRIGVQ
jgi:uncharacterized protein (TIRG00374 family)